MLSIAISTDEIGPALDKLLVEMSDMSGLMSTISDLLMEQTLVRFEKGVAPDGTPWAPKSAATLEAQKRKGFHDPRPLHRLGALSKNVNPASGPFFAEVSTSMEYGAMMQFGGTKAAFPHLWGDIPARPFFGIGPEDEDGILATVNEWLAGCCND